MHTKTDASYGVIPLFKNDAGVWEVLVIHQYGSGGDAYWGFPKGHAEHGEVPVATARRELAEETGITGIEIDEAKTFALRYSFVHGDTHVEKTATFFIGVVSGKEMTLQAEELKDARWCTLTEARELLTHEGAKRMFDEVVSQL